MGEGLTGELLSTLQFTGVRAVTEDPETCKVKHKMFASLSHTILETDRISMNALAPS